MLVATLTHDAMLSGMEEVLLDSPDDVCMHGAYADVLIQSRHPASAARGRFIEGQLKLEKQTTPEQRRKLETRQRKLLREHGRAWFGPLADFLLDASSYRFELWRGWLESVIADRVEPEFLSELQRSRQARLLRRLVFTQVEPSDMVHLAKLPEAPFWAGLLELRLGESGQGEKPAVVLGRLLGPAGNVG